MLGSCKRKRRYSLCTDLARSECYIVKCKKARYRVKYSAFLKMRIQECFCITCINIC